MTSDKIVKIVIGILVVILALWFVKGAFATNDNGKVFWCHCAESGVCNTLHLPQQALQNAGHVSAQGAPLHAGDHAGACVEPTVTTVPTMQPTATPTLEPTLEPTVTPEVTPEVTPRVTVTPEPTVVQQVVHQARMSMPSAPTCPDATPSRVNDIWLEPDASGNGTLVLRWGVNTDYQRVNIVYGFEPHDARYSLLNTENDGREEIRGLDSNTHYWLAINHQNGCAPGEYSDWIDPLP